MYGIYANIWGILMVNVTIYSSTMDPMGYGLKNQQASLECRGSLRPFHPSVRPQVEQLERQWRLTEVQVGAMLNTWRIPATVGDWMWLARRYLKPFDRQDNPTNPRLNDHQGHHSLVGCTMQDPPSRNITLKSSGSWFGTIFSPIVGMMIQSDFHIFQGGWNHQLVIVCFRIQLSSFRFHMAKPPGHRGFFSGLPQGIHKWHS